MAVRARSATAGLGRSTPPGGAPPPGAGSLPPSRGPSRPPSHQRHLQHRRLCRHRPTIAGSEGAGACRALPATTRQTFLDVSWKLSQEVQSLTADRTGRARYATITAPALILAGERTPPTELHTVQQLAQALPHATLRVFPGMGHMGPITHAAEVNAAIAAFIERADVDVR